MQRHCAYAAACAVILLFPGSRSSASPAGAGGYRAAYFGATQPGAWSRYAMTSDGKTESAYIYKRLPDEDGRGQVELRVEFTAGQAKGTWSDNRYLLSRGVRLEDDALSFSKHCERLFMQTDQMALQEASASTLPYIVDASIDYAASVKFAGTATVEGRVCDHYTYHYVTNERNKTDFTGEVWMNASVPFGLVRESATLKDEKGKTTSKYTMTLTATGMDSEPAAPLPIAKKGTSKPEKLTLGQAFRKGVLKCDVHVDPASKEGAGLFFIATNTGETPVHLTLPAGATVLVVGSPIDSLHIRAKRAHTFDLAPGKSSPKFEVVQEGDRRVMDGKFTISVYEDKPLFSGSVTMGSVGQ